MGRAPFAPAVETSPPQKVLGALAHPQAPSREVVQRLVLEQQWELELLKRESGLGLQLEPVLRQPAVRVLELTEQSALLEPGLERKLGREKGWLTSLTAAAVAAVVEFVVPRWPGVVTQIPL